MKNKEAIKRIQEHIKTWYQEEWITDRGDIEALDMAIEALQEQQWIPCTPNTMPQNTDEVLTTYVVNNNKRKRFVETATWYEGDDGYWSSPWDEYRVLGTKIEVIAWMPLPEPYQEDSK